MSSLLAVCWVERDASSPMWEGCRWCAVLDAKIAKPRLTLSACRGLQALCPGQGQLAAKNTTRRRG